MVALNFSSEALKAPGWLKRLLAAELPCMLAPEEGSTDVVAEVTCITFDAVARHVSTVVRTPVSTGVISIDLKEL
jgi:hypothetical protein